MNNIKITCLVLLAILSFVGVTTCFADYIQLEDEPNEPVVLAILDEEKDLSIRKESIIMEAVSDNRAIFVPPGTKCVKIETLQLRRSIFYKTFLAKVILISGPHKGVIGWVLDDAVKLDYTPEEEYFNSGDTIVYLKNGSKIRGDIFNRDEKDGVYLVVFDGANDIFLKNKAIERVVSLQRQ